MRMTMRNARSVGNLLGVMGLSMLAMGLACSGSEDPGGSSAANEPPAGLIHRTVVHFNPDGTEKVESFDVTPAQSQQEWNERQQYLATNGAVTPPSSGIHSDGKETVGTSQAAISVDSSCLRSSLWVFSNTSCTASGGFEICFYGSGTANLSNYTQYCYYPPPLYQQVCVSWDCQVGSFSPGTNTSGYVKGW